MDTNAVGSDVWFPDGLSVRIWERGVTLRPIVAEDAEEEAGRVTLLCLLECNGELEVLLYRTGVFSRLLLAGIDVSV